MDAVPTGSRLTPPRALLAGGLVVAVLFGFALLVGRDGPPVIRLAGAGPAGAEAEAAVAADSARVDAAGDIEFEVTDRARFAAGEGTVWRLEPPSDLRDAAQDLAGRFELGEVTPTPDGGFTVERESDGTSLWVAPSGDWSFHRWIGHERDCVVEPIARHAVDPDMVEPGAIEPAEPGDGEPDEATRPEPDAERERPALEPCPEPTPPTGVPDATTARERAQQLFADLDAALAPDLTEAYADEWGAWVSGAVRVGGRSTDLFVSVGFAGDAAVVSASGSLARPVEVADYPTVDADEAVERLRDRGGSLHAPMLAIDPAEVVEDPGLPDEPVEAPVDPDDAAVTILPSPERDAAAEPWVVRLVAAEAVLLSNHGADGSVWLLPGVRFTDEDGGTWQAMTVADGYVEVVEPETEPLPVEPEPAPEPLPEPPDEPAPGDRAGDGVDGAQPVDPEPVDPEVLDPEIQRLAEEVVGLSEAEAIDRLESAGAVARVVHRDGEDLAVTDDLRYDRVNLHVDGGVVVRAWVG